VDGLDFILELLRQAGNALVRLLIQPFFYIAIVLIVLQYFRQIRQERRLFSVRFHPWPRLLARTLLSGIATGLLVSAAALFLGVRLTADAVYWIWGAAAVLVLFRIHYLCFAYSVGLLGVLQWALGWFDLSSYGEWYAAAAESLAALDIAGLLLLVAVMHLAEALLVRRQGGRYANPLIVDGKRGRLVGAFQLQGYWPVPLLLLVPAAGGADTSLLWTPLLWHNLSPLDWTITALPMVIGFSTLTRSLLPQEKARQSAKGILLYAVILIVIAGAAAWWSPLVPAAALCALLLHEGLTIIDRRRESHRSPLFVHDERGLRVLAVVPGTPAAELAIGSGEIIHKVNGMKVRTKEELYQALHLNSAFCKLEVLNHEGQIKFVQRARFAGDHHQLGLVLSPDEQAVFYAGGSSSTVADLFRRTRTARRKDTSTTL
jgi:hypothetical protein